METPSYVSPWVFAGVVKSKKSTLEDMLCEVCRYYDVDVNDIAMKSQKLKIKDVRHIFIIYAYIYTLCSYTEIGNAVNRDRATAIYASKKYHNDNSLRKEFDLFVKSTGRGEMLREPLK